MVHLSPEDGIDCTFRYIARSNVSSLSLQEASRRSVMTNNNPSASNQRQQNRATIAFYRRHNKFYENIIAALLPAEDTGR